MSTLRQLLFVCLTATLTAVGQTLVSQPSDEVVVLGSEIRLTCTASKETVLILWRRNGQPVNPGSNHKLSTSTAGSLYVSNLRIVSFASSDEGTYECTAATGDGRQDPSRPFKLQIAKPPVVRPQTSPFYANESQTTILICTASAGIPAPSFDWFRKGKKLKSPGDGTLTISSVQQSAAGAYQCEAVNKAGKDQETFQLVVNYAPVVLLSVGNSLMFPVKQSRIVLCNATGLPKPNVWWAFGGKESRMSVSDPGSAALTLSGLDMDDSGAYTCNAENFIGKRTATVTVQLQGPPGIPPVPTLVRATVSSLVVRLTHGITGNSPITGYKLQYSLVNSNWTIVHVRPSDASEYELTKLAANTAYITKVMALNLHGRSKYSPNSQQFRTLPVLPKPARSVKAVASENTIRVSWKPPSLTADMGTLVGYKIKHYQVSRPGAVSVGSVSSSDTSYIVEGLLRGTSYMVAVYPFSQAGEADGEKVKKVLVNTTMGVPSAPNLFQAFGNGPTVIDLAWSKPTDDGGSPLLGYYVLMQSNSKGKWRLLNSPTGLITPLKYNIQNLQPRVVYRFRLKAANAIGNSTIVPTDGQTDTASKPPPARNFHVRQETAKTVTLAWNSPLTGSTSIDDVISSFRLDYKVNGESAWQEVSSAIEPTDTSFIALNLPSNTEYQFRLVSLYQGLESEIKPVASSQTTGINDVARETMSPPKVVKIGADYVELTWTPVYDGVIAYMLLYRVQGLVSWYQKEISADDVTYELDELSLNVTYEVVMRLQYEGGQFGPLSAVTSFTTSADKTATLPKKKGGDSSIIFGIVGAACGISILVVFVIVCLCCRTRPGRVKDEDITSIPAEWCPGNYTATADGRHCAASVTDIHHHDEQRYAAPPPVPAFPPPPLPATMSSQQLMTVVDQRSMHAVTTPQPRMPMHVPSAIVPPYTTIRVKTPSDHLPPYEPTEDTLRRQRNAPIVDPLPPTPNPLSRPQSSQAGERTHLPSASSTTTDLAKPDVHSTSSHIQSMEALDEFQDLPPPPPPVTEDDEDGNANERDGRTAQGKAPTRETAVSDDNDADREMSPPPPTTTPARPPSKQSSHGNGSMTNLATHPHRAASPIGALPASRVPSDMQSIGASSGRPMSTMSGNRPRHPRRRRNRSHSPGQHKSHRRRHQLLNGLPMKTLSPAASQHGSVGSWRPSMRGAVEIAVDLPPPDMPATLTEHTIV
eukprot:m.140416 g.140416  ORF g.140416 m.140416 type:complete len:1208 (+) comp38304_c0_seq5:263-3886(+)